jgi:predicted aspartyl protease
MSFSTTRRGRRFCGRSVALLCAGLAVALVGCAHSPAGTSGMAFSYVSPKAPLILVEGYLGNARDRAAMVLDTGATASYAAFLSTAAAQKMGLVLSDEIAPASSTAVGPRPRTYRTARLTRFELGPIVLHDVEVAVADWIADMVPEANRRIDAIVGYHLLHERVFSIDYLGRRLDLAASPGPDSTAIAFTLGWQKPLILVQATVNGAGPFTMEIDTGATTTILSPTTARRAGVASRSSPAMMSGAGGAVAVETGAARIAFGGIERDMGQVVVMPAMAAIAAAAGTSVDGILGTDFLYGTRLTIDYPRRRLWLGAAPAAARR